MRLEHMAERVGASAALDAPSETLDSIVRPALTPAPVRTALSGTWLGHRLHPALTDGAIAMLASASFLDLFRDHESQRGADRLLAGGLIATLPTAAAGLSDWIHTSGSAKRIGLAHALINTTALCAYGASLIARRAAARRAGAALSALGAAALLAGAYLGGHLSYTMGVGVNHSALARGPKDWTDALPERSLDRDKPRSVEVAGAEVLLAWVDGEVAALDNRCAHAGCPLDHGAFEGGAVTCSCHGSSYRLADGEVLAGPAASRQRGYESRILDGIIQIRTR